MMDSARSNQAELDRRIEKRRQISSVFTPARPVREDSLFSGRLQQIGRLVEALSGPGQHAVLFGEQGVGKTSLAQFVHRRWDQSIYVTCAASDDIDAVLRRIASEVTMVVPKRRAVGFHAADKPEMYNVQLSKLIGDQHLNVPDSLALLEALVNSSGPIAIFLDEFDRISDEGRRGFAELLKALSDSAIDCSLVLIGIADDVRTLLLDHQSVERNISQIRVPRMSSGDLEEILKKGCQQAEFAMSETARKQIVRLSHGLPYFTHLLALETLKIAAITGKVHAGAADLRVALARAMDAAEASLTAQLHQAISGVSQDHYLSVLRAASTCDRNVYGSFTMSGVRATFRSAFSDSTKDVAPAVDALCRSGRGPVLITTGSRTNRLIRFRSPLFEAYVDLHWRVERIASGATTWA